MATETPTKTKVASGESAKKNVNSYGMTADESNFLIDCLMHPVGGGNVAVSNLTLTSPRTQFHVQLHIPSLFLILFKLHLANNIPDRLPSRC